jgi:para-nitrobenzyl esterase
MSTKINRRSFVSGAALGASGILGGALNKAIAANAKDGSAQGPVANTTSGKIRGVVQENKVNAFRGVPYGAPTGGANRFMPPVKPEAWTGSGARKHLRVLTPRFRKWPLPYPSRPLVKTACI